MKPLVLLIPAFSLAACGLTGCGYTILRDLDEEALQAEVAAVESLTSGPDLMITGMDYEYVPPQGRRYPRGGEYRPAKVQFYLTVTNIGDVEFSKPYLLVLRDLDPHSQSLRMARGFLQNRKKEEIAADSSREISFAIDYPFRNTLYSFTIVTNPIIQRETIQDLRRFVLNPQMPPLSREFRYDNNEESIIVPGSSDRSHNRQNTYLPEWRVDEKQ